MSAIQLSNEARETLQHIGQLAVKQSAERITRSLSTSVNVPIPSVHLLQAADVVMALSVVKTTSSVTAVTQPFFGRGLSGEALLIFTAEGMAELSQIMGSQANDETRQIELALEMASLLNGSCVQELCAQLDINVLLKHPSILVHHSSLGDVLSDSVFPWRHTLAIELNYSFDDYGIACDLIILFHEYSLKSLFRQVDYLLD